MSYSDVNVLNVGAGSCTVIESPSGRVSMIDINDGGELRESASMAALDRLLRSASLDAMKAKLVDPIAWCKANGINSIWRFVLSHPDADHMSGLRRVLGGELPASVFWDIPHCRVRKNRSDFKTDAAFEDWKSYQQLRDGQLASPQVIGPLRGAKQHYWTDDHIEILSPTTDLIAPCDKADSYNDASYVLRANHGLSSVLIPGDVESKAWNDMIDAGLDLSADILIAAHHGRKSGYSEEALAAIKPVAVIISTDKLDPAHDAEDEYAGYTNGNVFSTRVHGTIWARLYDDGSFELHSHDGRLARWTRTRAA